MVNTQTIVKKQNVVIFVSYKCQIWLTRRLIFCIYGTSFYYVYTYMLHSTKSHLIIFLFQIQTQGYLKMRFTKNSLEIDTIWKMIVTFAGIFSSVKCFSVFERFVEAWNKYVFGSEKRKKKFFLVFFYIMPAIYLCVSKLQSTEKFIY